MLVFRCLFTVSFSDGFRATRKVVATHDRRVREPSEGKTRFLVALSHPLSLLAF